MTPFLRLRCVLPVALCYLVILGHARAATVIYRETFGNSTTGNRTLSVDTSWHAYANSGGTDVGGSISNAAGAPSDLDNVGTAKGASASLANGVAYYSPGVAATVLFETSEMTLSNPATSDLTFTWYEGNGSTSITDRIVVEIGGSWYATDATFASPTVTGTNFSTAAVPETFSFTLAGGAWRDLTFTAGNTLSLASSTRTADLPSGDITAFGLYANIPSGIARFDTFTVSAAPEAATTSLLGGAFLGLVLVGLRRRILRPLPLS